MTIGVLIVDDQELARTGFRLFLESRDGITVVGEAGDGDEAIDRAAALRPEVVLMDVRMPRMNGVDATEGILELDLDPPPRILILTTFDLDEYVYGALRAGASGFLLKDAPRDKLVEAIEVIDAGDALLSPTITRRLIEGFAGRPMPPQRTSHALNRLTAREREVLGLVARGLTNAEIADVLVVTTATAKSHVGAILQKLTLRDRAQAVVFAYEFGVVTVGGGGAA